MPARGFGLPLPHVKSSGLPAGDLRTGSCLLDCYWVGSLDLLTFWLKSSWVFHSTPKKVFNFFAGGPNIMPTSSQLGACDAPKARGAGSSPRALASRSRGTSASTGTSSGTRRLAVGQRLPQMSRSPDVACWLSIGFGQPHGFHLLKGTFSIFSCWF